SSDTPKPAEIKSQSWRSKAYAEKKETPVEQREVTAGIWFVMSPLKVNPRQWTDRKLMSLRRDGGLTVAALFLVAKAILLIRRSMIL
ncbi:hypothetical protein QTP86_034313, partial [Hemibagrus guttatus]